MEPTLATIYMNSGAGFQSTTRSATHQAGTLNAVQIDRDPNHKTRIFDGSIDDVRIYDVAMSLTDMQDLFGAGRALSPRPVDGGTGVTFRDLTWAPGAAATSNQIYLGTDRTSVENATTASPQYKASTSASGYRASIKSNTTYYWRVEQQQHVEQCG